MERIRSVFQNLTLFQWLALIAFIFGCISVTNAFFSLKSRYLDWRGVKSKREFERRSKQLEDELSVMLDFIEHPIKLFSHVLHRGLLVLILFLSAFALGMAAVLIYISPFRGTAFRVGSLFLAFGLLVLFIALVYSAKLYRLVTTVREPHRLVDKIFAFIRTGSAKGFNLKSDKLAELSQAIIAKVDFSQFFKSLS